MQITESLQRSAHFYAGAGGDMCGFSLAGLRPTFAVEINRYRCKTLRLNFPQCKVFEGPIQQLLLANYPVGEIPIFFITFPCDHYTLAANMHGTWTGDALYLEALREIVLHYPEIVILENVLGIKTFSAGDGNVSRFSVVLLHGMCAIRRRFLLATKVVSSLSCIANPLHSSKSRRINCRGLGSPYAIIWRWISRSQPSPTMSIRASMERPAHQGKSIGIDQEFMIPTSKSL